MVPNKQAEIDKLERIQKHCTGKIEAMEHMNYHERLKELEPYSQDSRREGQMMIYAWQQRGNKKETLQNGKKDSN